MNQLMPNNLYVSLTTGLSLFECFIYIHQKNIMTKKPMKSLCFGTFLFRFYQKVNQSIDCFSELVWFQTQYI